MLASNGAATNLKHQEIVIQSKTPSQYEVRLSVTIAVKVISGIDQILYPVLAGIREE